MIRLKAICDSYGFQNRYWYKDDEVQIEKSELYPVEHFIITEDLEVPEQSIAESMIENKPKSKSKK